MTRQASKVKVFSPAKVNLFLAVTGLREDGFHELLSLAAPLHFGDELTVERTEQERETICVCDDPDVPDGLDNLAARAAVGWLDAAGVQSGVRLSIEKHIPVGAGLGGGSSNASATLRALNGMAETALSDAELARIAAEVGSDCPFFLTDGSCVIRGRGEHLVPLPKEAAARLTRLRVLLFRPPMSLNTKEVYGSLSRRPEWYSHSEEAEQALRKWLTGDLSLQSLIHNDLEKPVFAKYPAFPVLLEELRKTLDLPCGMSGSGSCCFALAEEENAFEVAEKIIREAWGPQAFVKKTGIRY